MIKLIAYEDSSFFRNTSDVILYREKKLE